MQLIKKVGVNSIYLDTSDNTYMVSTPVPPPMVTLNVCFLTLEAAEEYAKKYE